MKPIKVQYLSPYFVDEVEKNHVIPQKQSHILIYQKYTILVIEPIIILCNFNHDFREILDIQYI